MRIYYERELNHIKEKTALSLGSFEALHAGHIRLVSSAAGCAERMGLLSTVTIFNSPVLKSRTAVCETLDDRLSLLEKYGAEAVVIFEFDDRFRKITAEAFFYDIIIKKLNASHIFSGFNYSFGYRAEGNAEYLAGLCEENNVTLTVIPPVKNGCVISSSYIYDLILRGEVEELSKCLLRPYSLKGTVTDGRKIGRTLGFPTANISYPENKAVIKAGVYFCKCGFDAYTGFCIVNVGSQPTVADKPTPKIECHILDFSGDVYGKEIRLDFLKRMRDIKVFGSLSELKRQLELDRKTAYEFMYI